MGEIVEMARYVAARNRRRRALRLGVGLALGSGLLAACANLRFAATESSRGAPVVLTAQRSSASVLVVVGALRGVEPLVAETVRPDETVAVLESGAEVLAAGSSPGPVSLVVPGAPRPGPSGTTFQRAENARAATQWHEAVAAGRAELVSRETASLNGFVARLGVPANLSGPPISLAEGIALAKRAETSLAVVGEDGGHRVIVVGTADLSSAGLAANSLDGDAVIVDDPTLPSPATIQATVSALYGAGAAWAVVVDPVSVDTLPHLVATGLATTAVTESFGANVLFANDSAALGPTATAALSHLVGQLGTSAVQAVVNAYASSTGTPQANLALSTRRGAAVAAFLATHGVAPDAIAVFAHGASDFVAPGPSPENRRVSVVLRSVELPSAQ